MRNATNRVIEKAGEEKAQRPEEEIHWLVSLLRAVRLGDRIKIQKCLLVLPALQQMVEIGLDGGIVADITPVEARLAQLQTEVLQREMNHICSSAEF